MKKTILTLLIGVTLSTGIASAQTTFQAFLTGLGENPTNASPASGFGQVILNAAQNQITVDENWSGLLAPATASHIHNAPPNANGPVIFPLSGVPAATAGAIPTQTFSITAAQVAQLFGGNMYFNIHDSTFPGGEIRGQLQVVPEPSTLALVGLGVTGVLVRARNKKRATKA